jgi:hypothetical protein
MARARMVPSLGDAGVGPAGEPAADHTPRESAMADQLQAAGLDLQHLPALDDVPDDALEIVMKSFTKALGVKCKDCHADDYTTDTPEKRVAQKMWDEFVRKLTLPDGKPLYCDSCHQGSSTFLDRSDASHGGTLGKWMKAKYVEGLRRKDGAEHKCSTCHGSPFVGNFLDDWAGADEPDGGIPTDGGVADLAAPGDLAMPKGDLAPAKTGCGALVSCLNGCAANSTTCSSKCVSAAPAAAKSALTAATDCANSQCIAAKRCVDANDNSSDCVDCFNNALSGGATGDACSPANDPACALCAVQWVACTST